MASMKMLSQAPDGLLPLWRNKQTSQINLLVILVFVIIVRPFQVVRYNSRYTFTINPLHSPFVVFRPRVGQRGDIIKILASGLARRAQSFPSLLPLGFIRNVGQPFAYAR